MLSTILMDSCAMFSIDDDLLVITLLRSGFLRSIPFVILSKVKGIFYNLIWAQIYD